MSLLAAIPLIDKVLGFIPNPQERQRIKGELEAAEQRGELDLALGQISINKQEAAHKSIFVAGWRPFIGWTCGIALAYSFVLSPVMRFVAVVAMDEAPVFPTLQTGELMTLVMGMLGLGGLRTYEKYKGVSREK